MTPEDFSKYTEVCRTRILAQHDQEIEEALKLSRDDNMILVEAVLLSEQYKRSPDPRLRHLGLLLSIGYNVCAESKYQRGKPEETPSDG